LPDDGAAATGGSERRAGEVAARGEKSGWQQDGEGMQDVHGRMWLKSPEQKRLPTRDGTRTHLAVFYSWRLRVLRQRDGRKTF
jgi:hypothetical protein